MKKIKCFLSTQLSIGVLLSGCNLVGGILSYGSSSSSLIMAENNYFATTNFPLESCGDSLPDDPQAYPLELYTVFILIDVIDYDEEEVQLIEKKYCQQVLSFVDSHVVIQLGTFIGREKAEQFKEIVSQDLENVQIIGPEIVRGEFSQIDDLQAPKKFESTEEIAKAALLSESQMQELFVIDRSEASLGDSYYTIKIVVPTYISQGFELTQFDIRTQVPEYGSDYTIWYKNPVNNQCFSFRGGFVMPIGGGAGLSAVVNANSRALGSVPLTFTSSEQIGDRVSYIGFYDGTFTGRSADDQVFGDFVFNSPSYGFDEEPEPCEPISFVEAVKIAESFEFLQP